MYPTKRINMRRILLRLLPILLLLGIVLAGCGKASPGSNNGGGAGGGASSTVNMDPTNSTQHSITVAVNQPVHFSDNTDGGGLHILCVGTGNGGTNTCTKSGNAPAGLLGQGTTFNPGETKDFTFTKPGAYHVICTIHPGMYIDITVQ
jgi:plastocyanin